MDRSELSPSKIIAVHLNYRSRAAERGRIPDQPSYFLKPPSSMAGDGDVVTRPQGCELLCYEGEIAMVLGRTVRDVDPDEGEAAIGWIAAANDLGVYDMRWADRGSNVLAKGSDGFTPLGPRLVAASEFDLGNLALRTRVNGDVVQEDTTANLLFPFGRLVADLSRFMTLERGDLILTGTPANSRPLEPGDVVEVEVDGVGTLRNEIVEAATPLAPYGAMPKVTAETRAAALGESQPMQEGLSEEAQAALREVSTATLTVQLRRRGIGNAFLAGLHPTRPGERLLGRARTLRYVALREDVRDADQAELNAQKATIDSLEEGEVLVIEARNEPGAGTIGDILAARAVSRGAAGIITDGGIRDSPALAEIEIPTYYQAAHAAVLGQLHFPLEDNVPVTCAGVLVMPGDIMVGDAEGVLVVPAAMAEEVARDALEQELREAWSLERVEAGESVREVYPISEARESEFQKWRAKRLADEETTR